MRKRILSILLTACMVLTLLPTAALAAENSPTKSIADSSLYFRDDGNGTEYSFNNTDWTAYTGNFTITGSSTSDTEVKNTVIVYSGTHNIILSDCSIGAATDTGIHISDALSPFDIQDGTVNLSLTGSNKLYSAHEEKAGLHVSSTANLIITENSTGSLDVRCHKYNGEANARYGVGAGIGGNSYTSQNVGTITINGGEISAYSYNGAGIGSGLSASCTLGNITISGGTVSAYTDNGYSIGHGYCSTAKTEESVTITGGSVYAPKGISGTLRNNAGDAVELYTLTLSGVSAHTEVTSLNLPDSYTYGVHSMKTAAGGKLYIYLPSSKTGSVSVTTATAGDFSGSIVSNAATLTTAYAVSGAVTAGTTEASVSGLTVNLYASTDTAFATSVGSAVTSEGGAYTIFVQNGSYVARVAGAPGSYAASVSGIINVSGSPVSGADITLSREAYSGDVAATPSLVSKTDTQVVLNAVTVAGQTVEYGKNTSDAIPTAWQDTRTFTDLAPNTTYYFFARVKQAGAVDAGGVSTWLAVTTKNAAPAAPSLTFSSISSDSVTIAAVTGAEYSKDNGATWQDGNEFTDLSAAAQYFFAVRIKETADTAVGTTTSQAQYTAAATPSAGVGYSVDYAAEAITVSSGYEVNTDASFGAGTATTSSLNPNTTYYVRVAATGSVPASEAVSFTIPARTATPTAITDADITKTATAITIANTVAGQEYQVNGTWYTPVSGTVEVTGLAAGTDYSIVTRVKASANIFASANSEALTVKTKTASAALTDSGVTYSVKNGTVTGLGSTYEYSLDNGATWQTAPVTGVTFAAGNVIQVRTKETDDAMPSLPQTLGTIGVLAAAPAYVIDYAGEKTTVSVPATVEYNTDSATATTWTAGQDALLSLAPDTTYYFRTAATDAALSGSVQTLVVPARPAAPDASAVTIAAGEDGSHTGITLVNTYEYILADVLPGISSLGTAGTGSATEITAVGGQHVYIRVKATANTSFASDWTDCGEVRLGVDDINLSGVGYDVAAGTLTGTTVNMEYQVANGAWTSCTAPDTSDVVFAAGTVKVRQKDKVTNEATVSTLASAAESDALTLGSKTYNSVKLTAMTGYEYSKDGGVTWQDSNVFSGLSGSTAYSFVARIKATAATLPGTISAALSVTTSSASSTGSGSSPASTGAPVIVDGKTENIGTEKKAGSTTTVTVDQSKLGTNIGGATSGSSVVVPVSENGAATASLVVKNIEDMAAKSMTLTVQSGGVAYNLNTAAIDTAALAAAFPGANMSAVPFNVTITNSSVSIEGETMVLSPVEFTVTAAHNGKTVDVDTFSAYIDRVIEVTAEQAAKITTAVVVNTDGSTRHVPTNVIKKDGKYYAVINSRTNSTYALIENNVTFADAAGKWYEAAVNEMGSRKIIAGRSASVFDGGASITRAEFAAILVRALGLPADGTSTFSDVPAGAWYTGAVATAVQYGLTEGKNKSRFDPNANITRQEAMAMLQRAAALTEFAGTSSGLDSFADADSVGSWARDAVQWNVGSGLIQGTHGTLNPTADITRAESAVIILRLLQKAGLVDVRS